MDELSSNARILAENFRYSGDTLRPKSRGDTTTTDKIRDQNLHDGLLVSPSVTPILANSLNLVCERLQILENSVEAFIYASPEVQAECYAGSKSSCVIRFSSSLIELLDSDEFEFVAGHELGHFLLDHGLIRSETQSNSIEFVIENRAQEISADRIGLVACQSLEISIRSMMKTVSGLSSEHLRFDVGAFVSQLQRAPEAIRVESRFATHPSILVRCRALLWFSMSDAYNANGENLSRDQVINLDNRIKNDMDKFVDGPARQLVEEAEENLAIWIAASLAVQDGAFSKHEQDVISEMFGEEVLKKLKNFLSDVPAADVQDIVFERMKAAREDLEILIPSGLESTVKDIWKNIEAKFTLQRIES